MATVTTDLKQEVKNHLVWDDRLVTSGIEIEVREDGTVQLNGTVPSYYNRILAGDDVASVPGVRRVVNNLRIKYPDTFVPSADGDIETTIENMLAWDSRLDSPNLSVVVKNGVVTLEGSVTALWKKNIAEEQVKRMNGITDIVNKITVVPTKDVVDEAIAKDIEDALDRNTLINPDDVTVEVSNSFVTLRGTVPSYAAKGIANDLASYTKGVLGVRDMLEVR